MLIPFIDDTNRTNYNLTDSLNYGDLINYLISSHGIFSDRVLNPCSGISGLNFS
jgi:hypothetical protein